ncbi:MAG: molybdopterin-synthase adenylyltransferase MoeB [Alphaproteobacteria bacterium]|nr:molybdopterin-synthase adenylyltransferase MoeB [Alphaproteobacteria bacterium]
MALSDEQLERYARHILLREVGGAGQARLRDARVLVVGAGGLGSPALLYLSAAGVGTIGIVDDDEVSLSNLQRQIAHRTQDIGRLKVESASESALAINPDTQVNRHATRINAHNALELVRNYDIVLDGSDNFPTRFLVNDACFLATRPLVSAAIGQFDGQLAVFKAHQHVDGVRTYPCYRCLYPEAPPPGTVPSCTEAGILGALAGVMGTLQALEALKEILGIGETMAGRLTLYDGLGGTFRTVRVRPDPACALCGPQATMRDLSHHGSTDAVCTP